MTDEIQEVKKSVKIIESPREKINKVIDNSVNSIKNISIGIKEKINKKSSLKKRDEDSYDDETYSQGSEHNHNEDSTQWSALHKILDSQLIILETFAELLSRD